MSDILFQYHKVNPTTWVYLSSLLTIGLYLQVQPRVERAKSGPDRPDHAGPRACWWSSTAWRTRIQSIEQVGYIWLFVTSGIFMVRLLLDPMMVRRPLLEPNLSVGGMTFLGISLLVFLMANVVNSKLTARRSGRRQGGRAGAGPAVARARRQEPGHARPRLSAVAPAAQHFHADCCSSKTPPGRRRKKRTCAATCVHMATARTMAILSHLAIVIGMVLIGYRHFDNIRTGIAAATLYLLLPYTAQLTGRVDHVLPAALLVWAVEAYRRPLVSGMLMGLAIGVIYYPGVPAAAVAGLLLAARAVAILAGRGDHAGAAGRLRWRSRPTAWPVSWRRCNRCSAGRASRRPGHGRLLELRHPATRCIAIRCWWRSSAFCISLALWPAQKNLGTLMSCSAAVMLATQFWHPHGGGLYMAWYLPLMLLTIFRPNLEDRVALSRAGRRLVPQAASQPGRRRAGGLSLVRSRDSRSAALQGNCPGLKPRSTMLQSANAVQAKLACLGQDLRGFRCRD